MGKAGQLKKIYSHGVSTAQGRADGAYELYGRDEDGLLVRAVIPGCIDAAALRAVADDMDSGSVDTLPAGFSEKLSEYADREGEKTRELAKNAAAYRKQAKTKKKAAKKTLVPPSE